MFEATVATGSGPSPHFRIVMAQQRRIGSPEKTKQQIACNESRQDSVALSPILQLQKTLGNQRVAQLIQAKRLAPRGKIVGLARKRTVSAAVGRHEQEAEGVADKVRLVPASTAFSVVQSKPLAITPFIQWQGEEDEEEFRATNKEEGLGFFPESEGAFFEPRVGRDLHRARLLTSEQAGMPARTIQAKALTVGGNVVFSQGRYSPGSSERSGLLAHELTRVIQQERGPENKRQMHGRAPLRRAQDTTVPSPDVVMRKVRTSSSEVLKAFQALCPTAGFASGQGGFIAGRGCAGVSTSQTTCRCLCYAVRDRTLYQIDVKTAGWSSWPTFLHDWSFVWLPTPSVFPHTEGTTSAPLIVLPSASSPGVFGAFDPGGNCIPCALKRLLAHELCGHAVGGGGDGERGNRPAHNDAIDIENDIAQEQGWPARGRYVDTNQGESYSQQSGDPKVVYNLKDGWHYEPCTQAESPPEEAHPRRRRRRRKRSSTPQQKITNTENVRLVSEPKYWVKDAFLIERLPKGTTVEVLDKGAEEPFNQTALEYQWWKVRADGKEGWVMQVLLDDVTESP